MDKKYYKIEDGKTIFYNGGIIVLNDRQIINPTEEQLLEAGWMIYVEPPTPAPTPQQLLEEAIQNKIEEIKAYNDSDDVNGFIINGEQTWVPVERRINLRMSINSYLALQIPTMTKIWNNKEYTFTTDKWDLYLNQVEVYASECLNVTLRHAAYVQTMTNIDDVEAFDVTADYPVMPEFTTDDYSNE